jgi:hypothetical protein
MSVEILLRKWSAEILLRKYGKLEWTSNSADGSPACKLIGGPIYDEVTGNAMSCSWLYWGTGDTKLVAMEDVIMQIHDELRNMVVWVETV